LVPFFKGKYLVGIAPDDIEQFKAMRREEVSGPSVNRELTCLKTMMNRAHKNGKIDINPAAGVKKFDENPPRARFLDDEEMVRFVDLAAPGVKPFFEIALITGMRFGEIRRMRWADLDFKSRTILIPMESAKSKRPRTIPMDAVVYELLSGLERKAETVFFNSTTLRPLASVQRAFGAVCRKGRFNKAGQERLTFHGLRHSAISGWLRHGVDIVTAAKLAGHSDIRITAGYCHSSAETGRQAVSKIGELFTPKAKQIGNGSAIEPSGVSVSRSYLSTYEGRLN
jgi:integrase